MHANHPIALVTNEKGAIPRREKLSYAVDVKINKWRKCIRKCAVCRCEYSLGPCIHTTLYSKELDGVVVASTFACCCRPYKKHNGRGHTKVHIVRRTFNSTKWAPIKFKCFLKFPIAFDVYFKHTNK